MVIIIINNVIRYVNVMVMIMNNKHNNNDK